MNAAAVVQTLDPGIDVLADWPSGKMIQVYGPADASTAGRLEMDRIWAALAIDVRCAILRKILFDRAEETCCCHAGMRLSILTDTFSFSESRQLVDRVRELSKTTNL